MFQGEESLPKRKAQAYVKPQTLVLLVNMIYSWIA